MRAAVVVVAVVVAAACPKPPPSPPRPPSYAEPLFDGLGAHARAVATTSPAAQQYFDQGVRFLFGFNHDEAIRSFEQAAAIDPQCAACFVFVALANGPHINNPALDEEHRTAANTALAKARAATGKTDVERVLIDALDVRYKVEGADAQGYAKAMESAFEQFPDDDDFAALYAEALIDLRPWDQWTREGKPQPGTEHVILVLERTLARAPNHPLANHLWIHVWEASPTPARADAAAQTLRSLAPGLAHLVHMPTHVDVRTGRFDKAIASSEAALQADKAYVAKTKTPPGFYRFYIAHNEHMLAYAAMMTGQRAKAVAAIEQLVKDIPSAWLTENAAVADGIVALPLEVKMRFGLWDDILATPDFDPSLPIARAMRHAARAVASAAKGDVVTARAEIDGINAPTDARFGNNSAADLLDVARELALGEIDLADKKVASGIKHLDAAHDAELRLQYDEPPDWMQPTAHTLGIALLNAGDAARAEAVYRADLERVPNNGWSLLGLAQALEAQGKTSQAKTDEAKKVRAQFDDVWKHADMPIATSCMCQQRKGGTK